MLLKLSLFLLRIDEDELDSTSSLSTVIVDLVDVTDVLVVNLFPFGNLNRIKHLYVEYLVFNNAREMCKQ